MKLRDKAIVLDDNKVDNRVDNKVASSDAGVNMRFSAAWWLALIAAIGFVVAGAYVGWRGMDARNLVRAQISAENIITPEDASIPNTLVDSAETALSQANVIQKHTLAATGGKTYAELDRTDPVREIAFTGSALRTALLSTVLAFNTANLVMGIGAFIGSLGLLGLMLLVLLRSKFQVRER